MPLPTANNALSALIDNHLHQGNELGIDQRRILWKRKLDLNDRALRHVTVGLGGPLNGIPRRMALTLQLLPEIMAILFGNGHRGLETSFGEYRYWLSLRPYTQFL